MARVISVAQLIHLLCIQRAAFQYGLKMTEGRKTRRVGTEQGKEKAKLDKEWGQISQILDKRKSEGGIGGSSGFKKPKF